MMKRPQTELRYQKILRDLKSSRLGTFWNGYVTYYSSKLWGKTKTILWGLSVGAIIFLLPVGLETALESEAQVLQLNSQISGDITPKFEQRPY